MGQRKGRRKILQVGCEACLSDGKTLCEKGAERERERVSESVCVCNGPALWASVMEEGRRAVEGATTQK